MNRKRQARQAIMDLNKRKPAPLNGTRLLEILFKMITAFAVDGAVQAAFGLPTLYLETDYAERDTAQLWVRIEAYLEMLS